MATEDKPHSPPRVVAVVVAFLWLVALVGMVFVMKRFALMFDDLGGADKLPRLTAAFYDVPYWVYFVGAILVPAALIGKEWLAPKTGGFVDATALLALLLFAMTFAVAMFLPLMSVTHSIGASP